MIHDTSNLANDINTVVSTLYPSADMLKLSIRMEEVLSNYEIHRKSLVEIKEDINEKIDLYLSAMKLEGLSENTLEAYRGELGRFSKSCKKAVAQVRTVDIRSYLSSFDGIMMSTVSTKLTILKSFFGWMVREEIILRNPTEKIKPPKTPKRLLKGLSIEELEIVRESCSTLRQRGLIETFYSTACRLSEIASLNISDIDLQNLSARVIGKGDKERTVFLSHKAIYHLKKYLSSRNDDCEALFATVRKPYRRMSNRAIQREIDKIEKASGIQSKLTAHRLRHTFGNLSMNAGIELADLQSILGHSDPSSTLIYAQVSEERKQQAHRRYHVQ